LIAVPACGGLLNGFCLCEIECFRGMRQIMMVPTISQVPGASSGTTSTQERFQRLAADWKAQSRYLSNTVQMAMLAPYQQIIGMGSPAIPFILEELRCEPRQWFWALEAITGENPVPNEIAGKVRESAQAWIEWGQRSGYIKS
jgi:hypothetical protein